LVEFLTPLRFITPTADYLTRIARVDAVVEAFSLLATDATGRQDMRSASNALWHLRLLSGWTRTCRQQ